MPIRSYNPTTPSMRYIKRSTFEELTKDEKGKRKRPERKLVKAKKRSGGRNSDGRITMRGRGGGNTRNSGSGNDKRGENFRGDGNYRRRSGGQKRNDGLPKMTEEEEFEIGLLGGGSEKLKIKQNKILSIYDQLKKKSLVKQL